jgi:hypothetical protein
MKHVLKDLQANLHGLVESLFKDYARQLRADYPKQTIRNSVVITSAVQEFARLGYIELVDVRLGIPADIPKRLVRTIKRSRHHPIWIPGPGFPDDPWDLYDQMKPPCAAMRSFGSIYPPKNETRGAGARYIRGFRRSPSLYGHAPHHPKAPPAFVPPAPERCCYTAAQFLYAHCRECDGDWVCRARVRARTCRGRRR